MFELILASQSPRRQLLLREWGYKFRTLSIEVSEIPDENLNIPEQICDIAKTKVLAGWDQLKSLKQNNILVLSADTAVVFAEQILGKPKDRQEAITTLRLLSGQSHRVITGFCFYDGKNQKLVADWDATEVQFRSLSEAQIRAYVETGSPMDKAGAYGIQDVGGEFVERTEGSYENVVGLPMQKLQETIENNGWTLRN